MTEIRVIRSAEDLAALQPQWWDLWRRAAAAPPFLSPAWLLPWWQAFRGAVDRWSVRRALTRETARA